MQGYLSPAIHKEGNEFMNTIGDFGKIIQVINNVATGVFNVSTALVALMVILVGIYLMFNRDTSISARLEKLSWLKTVLMGYGIILSGTFLVHLVTTSLQSGGITR